MAGDAVRAEGDHSVRPSIGEPGRDLGDELVEGRIGDTTVRVAIEHGHLVEADLGGRAAHLILPEPGEGPRRRCPPGSRLRRGSPAAVA